MPAAAFHPLLIMCPSVVPKYTTSIYVLLVVKKYSYTRIIYRYTISAGAGLPQVTDITSQQILTSTTRRTRSRLLLLRNNNYRIDTDSTTTGQTRGMLRLLVGLLVA